MNEILDKFKTMSHKERVELLNLIVRDYPAHVSFAAMSEIEKKIWAPHFNDISKEYFGVK